jgi:DNA (cytosine-5)-methyltransferase 3A
MNVLSLFDGMSCGQVALSRLGVKPEKYFASEIDKYAIQVTQKNFPETVQLGDVQQIDVSKLPKIDLLIGGSPCQGFSVAGKGLNFEDLRSKLFFDFVRIKNELQELNPDLFFLLENVKMKTEWVDIISQHLGVKPISINSSLVSAQNRVRLYWTNIPNVTQPEDKGIFTKDILEENVSSKYEITPKNYEYIKAKNREAKKHVGVDLDKAICLTARSADSWNQNYVTIDRKGNLKKNQTKAAYLQVGGHGAGNHSDMDLIAEKKRFLIPIPKENDSREIIQINESTESNGRQPFQQNRVYHAEGLSPQVSTTEQMNVFVYDKIRRYTPVECERLQTLPDNYTDGVSDTQRYRMLGNGWTVDVIVHILGNLPSSII